MYYFFEIVFIVYNIKSRTINIVAVTSFTQGHYIHGHGSTTRENRNQSFETFGNLAKLSY